MFKKIPKSINKQLFNDIDIKLLSGIQCQGGNKSQQNYLERLKVQTENAFINRKFKKY